MKQHLHEPSTRSFERGDRPERPTLLQRASRPAFWVFVAVQVIIFFAYLWNFHGRWFVTDEWDFLAGRTAGNLSNLLDPHNEHWSTLPILYFRLLWNLFGIRSYMPYLTSVVGLHIAIGFLLRWIMVRAKVMPWIATICALVFSLYGAGFADISYAFNIGFDGSVLFGLLFLVAVDHDGPAGRRDVLGSLAGLGALLCSGIGVTMVMAVFVAILIRHGARRATISIAPLAAVYIVWYVTLGHRGVPGHASPSALVKFTAYGLAYTFSSLGSSAVVGGLLVLLLVIGTYLNVGSTRWNKLRTRYAAPYALLIGAVAFMAVTGFGRANDALPSTETYAASRYIYIAAAMLIPAIAVAASYVISRWPLSWPVVVLVLVLGVPGNIAVLHRNNYLHTLDAYRQRLLTIPRLPIASSLPRSYRPDTDYLYDPWVTLGWLLDGVKEGKVPPPPARPTPIEAAFLTLQLAWHPGAPAPGGTCQPVPGAMDVHVVAGTQLTINAPVSISARYNSGSGTPPVRLQPLGRRTTYVSRWPMEVTVAPTVPRQPITLCTPSA